MIRLNKDHLDKLEIVTLQDFIELCQKDEHREDVEDYIEGFDTMYRLFKDDLAEKLPAFSTEQIIKISRHFDTISDVFNSWTSINILLDTLDFEHHLETQKDIDLMVKLHSQIVDSFKDKDVEMIKSDWDIRKCFEALRFDPNHHLGLGDIRLTIGQQEEICDLVEMFYKKEFKDV